MEASKLPPRYALDARQESLLMSLEALRCQLQVVESLFGPSSSSSSSSVPMASQAGDRKEPKKSKKQKQKQKQPAAKKKKSEARIYYDAPPPEPIPGDFKGIEVDVEKDLMGKDTDVQKRLRELCKTIPIPSAKFKRAPPHYYDSPLEIRRDILGAPHIDYLCKTMIMRNTKSKAKDCSDRTDSKYYMVVIQYTAKMNKEKLMKIIRGLRTDETKLSKKLINMRVASMEEGVALSGFGHNAVTPVGMTVKIPMIVSHRVLQLPYIWLGGGEVDVKLKISIPDLCRVFDPIIGDLG